MKYFIPIFIIVVGSIISILGFRGDLTENTPIEVFPDMDRQAKYKSQTKNPFLGTIGPIACLLLVLPFVVT